MSLIDVYPIESIPPEPWRNGGGVDWDATLVDGPSLALNVMTAKGLYRANVQLVDEPVVVRPGCTAIAVALDRGCAFAEGSDASGGDVMPGNVLVSEHHARPLRLAPRAASAGEVGRQSYAVLVTIEPAPVRKLMEIHRDVT